MYPLSVQKIKIRFVKKTCKIIFLYDIRETHLVFFVVFVPKNLKSCFRIMRGHARRPSRIEMGKKQLKIF